MVNKMNKSIKRISTLVIVICFCFVNYFSSSVSAYGVPTGSTLATAFPLDTPVFSMNFNASGVPNSFYIKSTSTNICNTSNPGKGFYLTEGTTTILLDRLYFSGTTLVATTQASGGPIVNLQVSLTGKYLGFYINSITNYTITSNTQFHFEFNTNDPNVKAFELDYMTELEQVTNSIKVNCNYLSCSYSGSGNPYGDFAVYYRTSDNDEDDTILKIWTTEDIAHPNTGATWDYAAAQSWVAKWQDQFKEQSTMTIAGTSPTDIYSLADNASRLGAKRIYMHTDTWKQGQEYWPVYYSMLALNPNVFPNGVTDLAAFSQYCLDRGMYTALHTTSAAIGPYDTAYVNSSNINANLASWGGGTLINAITPTTTVLNFRPNAGVQAPYSDPNKSTSHLPQLAGYFDPNFIQLENNEMCRISNINASDPNNWQITVTRGQFQTTAVSHTANATTKGLISAYGQVFVPDLNSALLSTMATNYANLCNQGKVCHLEYDAGEDLTYLGGSWGFYKYTSLVYSAIDHPCTSHTSGGTSTPCMIEYRLNSSKKLIQDGAVIASLANERSGREATRPLVSDFLMGLLYEGKNYRFDFQKTEPMFGISMSTLQTNGLSGYTMNKLKNWRNCFGLLSPEQRTIIASKAYGTYTDFSDHGLQAASTIFDLKATDKAYKLYPTNIMKRSSGDIDWQQCSEYGPVVPQQYIKAASTATMSLNNIYKTQTPNLIARNLTVEDYDSSENTVIQGTGVQKVCSYNNTTSSKYVTENVPDAYSVNSVDTSTKRGLGFNVTGDGSNAVLLIQSVGSGGIGNYAVKIDFTGTRYIEIPDFQASYSNGDWGIDNNYRGSQYGYCYTIRMGLGAVPANTNASVTVSGLKMLQNYDENLDNLSITTQNGSLDVSGSVPAKAYVWYQGGSTVSVYDSNWNFIKVLPATFNNFTVPNGYSNITVNANARPSGYRNWVTTQFTTVDDPLIVPIPSNNDMSIIPNYQVKATATSFATGHDAFMATDSSNNTFWQSNTSLPQSMTINLNGTYVINKFKYLPRQDGNTNGIVTGYNLYTSLDGTTFTQVASGTLTANATEKVISFSGLSAAYVKFEATSATGSYATVANVTVYKDSSYIPQSQMNAVSTSSHPGGGEAKLAIDNDSKTMWQTEYTPSKDPLPQSITISLGDNTRINQVRYVPRQDGLTDSIITGYNLYYSTDGVNFTLVSSGTWALDKTEKVINFSWIEPVCIKLEATSGGASFASAAEINVRAIASSATDTCISHLLMSATATSYQGGSEPSKAIDSDNSSVWNSQSSVPQSLSINLGGTYGINKLVYLPPQSGSNGIATGYNIYTSLDGTNYTLQTSGTLVNNATAKTITFNTVMASYVKFEVTAGGGGYAAVANIDIYKDPCYISHVQMGITATSYQSGSEPSKAIDSDRSSGWFIQYAPTRLPLPQSMSIYLGGTYAVNKLVYLPINSSNGIATAYNIYTSLDGTNYTLNSTGTLAYDTTEKTITFTTVTASYVKFEVTAGGGDFAGAANIDIYTDPNYVPPVKSISGVTFDPIANQTYTGSAITPSIAVSDGTTMLVLNTDYTVSYSNNINVGTATVTITGIGNYNNTASTTFTISTIKSISGVTFNPIANQTYTGSAITPTITVKDGTTTLVLNTDYTISYSNNVNVGTATVTITGIGNYNNTDSTTFTISANGIPGGTIYGNDTSGNTTRTGSGWGYQSTSSYSSTANDSVTFTVNVQNTGDTIQWYGVVGSDHGIANVYIDGVLKTAVDCYSATRLVDTLVFTSDSMTSGNHTIKIVVTGTHNASANGNYIEIYRIVDFATSVKSISGATIDPIANQTYTGSAITPAITVKDGATTLVLNTDYTVSYSNNINVGTATVTITGIGNYNNTANTTFTISAVNSCVTIYGNDTSSNTTRTGSGWVLQSGSSSCYSYTANDSVTFTLNVQNTGDTIQWYGVVGGDHGIANVYIDNVLKGAVDCYSATRLVDTLVFTSDSMTSGNHTIKIVVTGTHNDSANGTYIEIYRIVDFATSAKSISGVTFNPIANQTYTGSAITPTITVRDGATTLVLNTDYTVSYSNNINVGTATVTITGIGNYYNTASTTFTISADGNPGITIYGNDTSSNTTRTGSGWGLQSGSQSSYSVTANDSATFTVNVQNTGDTIQWYGLVGSDHGIANVYIDNVLKATVDCYSTTRLVDTLVFTSDPMSIGNHTIKIVVTGTHNASANGNYIEIYRIVDFTNSTRKSISGVTFDPIANQTYTSIAITPTITVKDDGTTLILNTDYTVSYSDNINVGTATVTITGIGNYNNTASTTFTISDRIPLATIYGNDTSSNTTRTGSGWGFQSTSSYSVTVNDSATFTVNVQNTGDTIQWYGLVGSDHGIANVYIDNVLKATVDCYSTTRLVDTLVFTSDPMSIGNHTIKIVVTGTHNVSANGNYIEIYRIVA
jgi:hypothetical protein